MGRLDTEGMLPDVIGLPTYIVDTVIRRDLGNGIASIIPCRKYNGLIIPHCEMIISVTNLSMMVRDANDFALEMYRRQQMSQIAEAIGSRH